MWAVLWGGVWELLCLRKGKSREGQMARLPAHQQKSLLAESLLSTAEERTRVSLFLISLD